MMHFMKHSRAISRQEGRPTRVNAFRFNKQMWSRYTPKMYHYANGRISFWSREVYVTRLE